MTLPLMRLLVCLVSAVIMVAAGHLSDGPAPWFLWTAAAVLACVSLLLFAISLKRVLTDPIPVAMRRGPPRGLRAAKVCRRTAFRQ